MHEALFYTKLENQTVRCDLCPWYCRLKPGQTGNCKVRENIGGTLVTHVYGKVAAFGIDPIEKKPLYHFSPGKNILSIGEVGCNLHCTFCQNHRISQCLATEFTGFHEITARNLVQKALKIPENIGIAYTYNEPFTFFEFLLETAQLTHENGMKNVVVSNGYINPEPLKTLLPRIDAFNIDLKAFSENFYNRQTKGKLAPVLQTLKSIAESRKHLEITMLVIPELNDDETDFEAMTRWIATELGNEVPLHLSRYFPQHEMHRPPTPVETLESLFDLAKKHLHHVYLGNVNDEKRSSSYCPGCGEILVKRSGYRVLSEKLNEKSCCTNCGARVNFIL
jgi:pyruvate formate lyase activating enzyme